MPRFEHPILDPAHPELIQAPEIDLSRGQGRRSPRVEPESPVFSFRAECPHDFDEFVRRAVDAGVEFSILQVTKGAIPGVIEPHVEIRTRAAMGWLQAIIRSIDDGHVMLQTLRPLPLSENSLERDYELE